MIVHQWEEAARGIFPKSLDDPKVANWCMIVIARYFLLQNCGACTYATHFRVVSIFFFFFFFS